PSPSGPASNSVMRAATAAPPVTGSDPPSQKSFCTSTISNARAIVHPPISGLGSHLDSQGRLTGGELEALPGDRDEAGPGMLAGLLEGGQVGHRNAAAQERALQEPVVRLSGRHALGHHDLLGGG